MINSTSKLFKSTPTLGEYQSVVPSKRYRGGAAALGNVPNESAPLMSIITVTYNAKCVLEKTIQSVLNQSYKNIEFIIIDGGSTDGTLEIIRRYNDKISLWISGADEGIADAMNIGLANAHGEVVNFLNAGDYYIDNRTLEYVAKWCKEEKWWWAYGLAKLQLDYRETSFKQKYRPFRKWKNYYLTQNCHQATFFRRELFNQIGLHSIGNDRLFDIDFFIRATRFSSPASCARMMVWYDITGLSSHVKFRFCFSRMYLTLCYCNPITAPLWAVLILVRWLKSAVGFWIKKVLLACDRQTIRR